MSQWQPQDYDPRQRQRPATPPQWGQGGQPDPWAGSAAGGTRAYPPSAPPLRGMPPTAAQSGQPQWQQPQYQPPGYGPHYPPPGPPRRRRQGRGYGPRIAAGAVALAAVAGGAFYVLHGRAPSVSPAPGSAAQADAQPETEAGVRATATQFYALYSAGQWAQSWAMLTPASQKAVSESTYAAVHEGCPSVAAGLARVIKSVTMAGPTAVVTETVAGAAGALGSVTDAWSYASGRWGIALSQSSMADYSHGSAAADVAALKAAGSCAS